MADYPLGRAPPEGPPLSPQIRLVGHALPLSCDLELWSESEDEDLTPISRHTQRSPLRPQLEITPDTSSEHTRGSAVSRD